MSWQIGVWRDGRSYIPIKQYALFHSDDQICGWWTYVQFVQRAQPISATDAWIAATRSPTTWISSRTIPEIFEAYLD